MNNAEPQIEGYELISRIGRGGMGEVYKARQKSVDRIVAIKILSQKLASDKRFIQRFFSEARAVAKLNHVNIIQGIDVGETAGYYYFVMEYVDGENIFQRIQREGKFTEPDALQIVVQMAEALDHASKHGLVHRDVKPHNILVARDGVAKLADLGLARTVDSDSDLTIVGTAVGTPNYISPEQARGEQNVDIRSDIYSLGATLYHMAVGQKPYKGASTAEVMKKHAFDPVPDPKASNPDISKPLAALIRKMMAKHVDDRPQNPEELLEDAVRVMNGEMPSVAGTWEVADETSSGLHVTPYIKVPAIIGVGVAAAIVLVVIVAARLLSGGDDVAPPPSSNQSGSQTGHTNPSIPATIPDSHGTETTALQPQDHVEPPLTDTQPSPLPEVVEVPAPPSFEQTFSVAVGLLRDGKYDSAVDVFNTLLPDATAEERQQVNSAIQRATDAAVRDYAKVELALYDHLHSDSFDAATELLGEYSALQIAGIGKRADLQIALVEDKRQQLDTKKIVKKVESLIRSYKFKRAAEKLSRNARGNDLIAAEVSDMERLIGFKRAVVDKLKKSKPVKISEFSKKRVTGALTSGDADYLHVGQSGGGSIQIRWDTFSAEELFMLAQYLFRDSTLSTAEAYIDLGVFCLTFDMVPKAREAFIRAQKLGMRDEAAKYLKRMDRSALDLREEEAHAVFCKMIESFDKLDCGDALSKADLLQKDFGDTVFVTGLPASGRMLHIISDRCKWVMQREELERQLQDAAEMVAQGEYEAALVAYGAVQESVSSQTEIIVGNERVDVEEMVRKSMEASLGVEKKDNVEEQFRQAFSVKRSVTADIKRNRKKASKRSSEFLNALWAVRYFFPDDKRAEGRVQLEMGLYHAFLADHRVDDAKNRKAAVSELRTVAKDYKDDPDIAVPALFGLVDNYLKLRKPKTAINFLRYIIKNYPEREEDVRRAEEMMERLKQGHPKGGGKGRRPGGRGRPPR